jgi:hypothetical protein
VVARLTRSFMGSWGMGAADVTDVLMAARMRARRVGFMMAGAGEAGGFGCVSFEAGGWVEREWERCSFGSGLIRR